MCPNLSRPVDFPTVLWSGAAVGPHVPVGSDTVQADLLERLATTVHPYY